MKSLFQRIAALVSLSSLLAAPAFAHGYGNGYRNWRWSSYSVRPITFGFESIEAHLERGELTVHYHVDPRSLRFATQSGISPVLQVEAGGQVFRSRIEECDGAAVFQIPRRAEPREAVVSVAGANGRYRIDTLSVDGRTSPRFTIPIEKACHDRRDEHDRDGHDDGHHDGPYHQPAMRWSFQPAVIQACGNAFEGQDNEQQCLRIVDAFAFDPVNTIDTCERTMEGDGNELACLQTAARSPFDRSQPLDACELAMEGDGNELACFAKVAAARLDPTPTINACEMAFDGDDNELACMDAAFRYSFNPVPVIQSCEMSMDGDPAELACLARY